MGIKQGIKQGIEQGIERGVKNTQIKIAIKMLVRNNQTLEEISEIVGLDLDALRELKKNIWLNGCAITSILYKKSDKGIALNRFEVY